MGLFAKLPNGHIKDPRSIVKIDHHINCTTQGQYLTINVEI
jgi:hypothetical protein